MRRLPLVVLVAALAVAPAADAHHRHHGRYHHGPGGGGGPSVKVIAQGLNSPRHLAFDRRGDLFVAEAGTGGADRCFIGGEGPACMGATGSVTRVDRWGRQSRVAEGLASYANAPSPENPEGFNNGIGPHGITTVGHLVIVTNGGPTEPKDLDGRTISRDELAAQFPYAANFGRVLALRGHGRPPVSLGDIWAFERDVNPDEELGNPAVDSNPDDVLFDGHRLVVSDAGGNALDTVDFRGRVRNLTVFPNVPGVPVPVPPPDKVDMQAVPTSVVLGPDHAYYVSQLTGFPFPVGAANIWRVDPRTGHATVFASGFTNLMDLAFGRDGTLYALEIDHDGLLFGPSPDGAIYKVDRRGNKQLVDLPADTLVEPGGITVGRDALYVTNHGTSPGGGEVLKIRLH
jgi:hypothetical protein